MHLDEFLFLFSLAANANEEIKDPNKKFVTCFYMGFFALLCLFGVFGLYLAPSKLGRLDQIYSLETTTRKSSAKSNKLGRFIYIFDFF